MVIFFSLYGVESFVITGGNAGYIADVDIICVSVFIVGIGYTGLPSGAVGLGADYADIAADVENVACNPFIFQVLCRLFGSVALSKRSNVK